ADYLIIDSFEENEISDIDVSLYGEAGNNAVIYIEYAKDIRQLQQTNIKTFNFIKDKING
ncbi:hypothetical protein KA977_15085, partial [Candidatus Dependentiae bacterium]|nr:hypothetical protein [Candidatus Dependentiae bacterium]